MLLRNYVQYRYCVQGLIDSPVVQKMSTYIQHSDVSTLEHCILVSFLSFTFCRILGWNYYAAARGGLLHDMFLYDWHEKEVKIDNPIGIFKLHGFTHPHAALDNAYENFDLSLIEVDIIEKHMWPLTPALPMYKESYVVSVMDKIAAIFEILGLNRLHIFTKIIKLQAVREQLITELLAVSQ